MFGFWLIYLTVLSISLADVCVLPDNSTIPVGSMWTKPECVTCVCSTDLGFPQLICYPCPEDYEPSCMTWAKFYIYTCFGDICGDVCCPYCAEVGCFWESGLYPSGPVPSTDPCLNCTCFANFSFQIVQCENTCVCEAPDGSSIPVGSDWLKGPPHCLDCLCEEYNGVTHLSCTKNPCFIGCELNGTLYPNGPVPSLDPCQSCTCEATKHSQVIHCENICDGQCTSCGSDCSKKNWTQINYERLTSDWNVKLVGDTYNQDATNALKKSGTKVFLDDRTPLVLTFKSYICVRLVRFDVSCAASAEVRLMDVSSGKEVVQASGPIAGGPGWTTITQPIGPCCVNRIKIRVWPSNDPNCKPQALAAIRHVGVEYCADGCTPAP